MIKKRIEVTIDDMENIHVSKQNLSYNEALSIIDYARAQLRLDSMRNERSDVAKNVPSEHIYSY